MIQHTPIMVKEIIAHVPDGARLYVDGTAGHGGHVAAIAASGKLAADTEIFAVDRDAAMLEKAKSFILPVILNAVKDPETKDMSGLNNQSLDSSASPQNDKIHFIQDSYAHINTILAGKKADFILLDIGVNMEHFKDGSRGFSVHEEAPLDMRFDTREGRTAGDILNTYSAADLIQMFINYGDFSPKSSEYFSSHILEARTKKPFITTKDLVDFLYSIGVRKNQLPIIFQCLRIETNQELAQLETFLKVFPETLNIAGRCAIITFHSTEDRIVKYAFKALEDTANFKLVNKKVIQPHYTEVQKNRAARSAKLRIIERIK